MRFHTSICVLLWTLLSVAYARSVVGNRVLVVLEDSAEKDSFSQFWADLESRNFDLSFKSPKAEELSLFKLGQLNYDHLILLPPKSKGYGPSLTPKNILDFTNAGGNVLLGLSSESNTPSAISSLLLEFDISLPNDRTSIVVDHFNYDVTSAAENHDVLIVPRPKALRPDVVNFFGGEGLLAVPKAVGQSLGNTSPLIAPILKAPATAYIYNPKDDSDGAEDVFATGSQIAIISALQARNSARFTVLGSLDMLKNQWFDAKVKLPGGKDTKTINKAFAQQLTEWTFKEVGVLKVGQVEHHQVADASVPFGKAVQIGFQNPEIYRIKSDVGYTIELSAWDRDQWTPYSAPAADAIQLEFSMLSPFHRIALSPVSHSSNSTTYGVNFRTPDQHGIFAFKVNYKRPFLTNVDERYQVTVRHFAHDEWPRSWRITGAWPWISGLWAVVGGFLCFVIMWLYCEPPSEDQRRKLAASK